MASNHHFSVRFRAQALNIFSFFVERIVTVDQNLTDIVVVLKVVPEMGERS